MLTDGCLYHIVSTCTLQFRQTMQSVGLFIRFMRLTRRENYGALWFIEVYTIYRPATIVSGITSSFTDKYFDLLVYTDTAGSSESLAPHHYQPDSSHGAPISSHTRVPPSYARTDTTAGTVLRLRPGSLKTGAFIRTL